MLKKILLTQGASFVVGVVGILLASCSGASLEQLRDPGETNFDPRVVGANALENAPELKDPNENRSEIEIGQTVEGTIGGGSLVSLGRSSADAERSLITKPQTTNSDTWHHAETPTPVSTDTPTPTSTEAPGHSPTSTPSPTAPTGIPPLCATHDNRAWHGLLSKDGSCHYNHDHGMNPRNVDDIFGAEYYQWAGGEISYPWETPDENVNKHASYFWMTWRNLQCPSSPNCPVAGRIQFHALMSALGATTRFHSIYMQIQVCDDQGRCGIASFGGWNDTGLLYVDEVWVPLPSDDDRPVEQFAQRRRHFSNPPVEGPLPVGGERNDIWYGRIGNDFEASFGAEMGFLKERWGPIDPNDPYKLLMWCPQGDCYQNGSSAALFELSGLIESEFDPDEDGLADFNGYTNRWSVINSDCTSPSLECVPVKFESMPVWFSAGPGDFESSGDVRYDNEDIKPEGVWWIEYPN